MLKIDSYTIAHPVKVYIVIVSFLDPITHARKGSGEHLSTFLVVQCQQSCDYGCM